MKKFLAVLFVILSIPVFAGGYGDLYPKWSIGIIGVGNYSMPASGFHPYFLPGIQVTHTNGVSWSQRGAIEFTKYSIVPIENTPGSADLMFVNGTEKRSLLRAGLEYGWFICPLFHPYVAIDVAGQSYKSNITYEGGLAGRSDREEISTTGIGLLPTIGFKTYIGKRIAFFAEYRAEAFLNNTETKVTYYNGNIDSRPTDGTTFDFRAGAIAHAGIQVMF
jgi:hypothetical protein